FLNYGETYFQRIKRSQITELSVEVWKKECQKYFENTGKKVSSRLSTKLFEAAYDHLQSNSKSKNQLAAEVLQSQFSAAVSTPSQPLTDLRSRDVVNDNLQTNNSTSSLSFAAKRTRDEQEDPEDPDQQEPLFSAKISPGMSSYKKPKSSRVDSRLVLRRKT